MPDMCYIPAHRKPLESGIYEEIVNLRELEKLNPGEVDDQRKAFWTRYFLAMHLLIKSSMLALWVNCFQWELLPISRCSTVDYAQVSYHCPP